MRGAFLSFVLVASLLLVACGGGDEGRGDLANSKVFDPAVVKRCLRDQGFRIEPRLGGMGIDFAVRWRTGLNTAEVAAEKDAGDAESREKEWRQIAGDAGIDDLDSYYFRYGNILIGYEKVPNEQDRARIERCLS